MTQPLDRNCVLPAVGEVDEKAGEFWIGNAFMIPLLGKNLSAFERNKLFLNMGGEFLDASFASQADIESDSRSVIAADFNRDGAPDLLVGSAGGGPLRLFLNRFPQGGRVRIDLRGVDSNRAGIGSRVVLHCGAQTIVRDSFCANGFMGQAPPELLVGVGKAERIDRLSVRWPSGRVQEFQNLPVDSRLAITEGDDRYSATPLPKTPAKPRP
ncbi:MAG: CRTAC1 family protein [Planctomycetaceae bacterium]